MAKKKTNKTQLIKEALEKHPDKKPAEIAEQLKKHGVTATYVSNVKASLGKKAPKTRPSKKKVGRPKASEQKVAVSDLVKAKKLADELGGVEKAQALLSTVAKLT